MYDEDDDAVLSALRFLLRRGRLVRRALESDNDDDDDDERDDAVVAAALDRASRVAHASHSLLASLGGPD